MIFYFVLMGIGLLIAGKLILGELRKEKQDNYIKVMIPEQDRAVNVDRSEYSVSGQHDRVWANAQTPAQGEEGIGISKIETILHDKNMEIERLKALLAAEQKHKLEYEKIKSLLQWQVFESRQMNREIQRQLKSLQDQEESRAAQESKLRSELVYKDQLLLKKDYQLADLNMAIQAHSITNTATDSAEKAGPHSSKTALSVDPYEDWRNKN